MADKMDWTLPLPARAFWLICSTCSRVAAGRRAMAGSVSPAAPSEGAAASRQPWSAAWR